jgi:hypothetical protein
MNAPANTSQRFAARLAGRGCCRSSATPPTRRSKHGGVEWRFRSAAERVRGTKTASIWTCSMRVPAPRRRWRSARISKRSTTRSTRFQSPGENVSSCAKSKRYPTRRWRGSWTFRSERSCRASHARGRRSSEKCSVMITRLSSALPMFTRVTHSRRCLARLRGCDFEARCEAMVKKRAGRAGPVLSHALWQAGRYHQWMPAGAP